MKDFRQKYTPLLLVYTNGYLRRSFRKGKSIRLETQDGFTFIEVLVAMFIFVMTVTVSISLTDGSVRATTEAKEISVATWLLQNVMVELETKLETEGLDKGCEKKKAGKFEAPYQNFFWTTTCEEIDFSLSETASQLMKQEDHGNSSEQENQTNMITKMILQIAGDYMTKSTRELHAEVSWVRGKQPRKVDATTHVARFDQPVSLPGIGAATPKTD